LRTRLVDQRPYEVVNASVPGYTSYQELLFFKRYASRTEPDLVIWTYCLNDNHKFLHRFDEQAHMLMTREAEESLKIHSAWDRVVSRSYFLSLLRVTFAASKRREAEQLSRYPWEGAVDFNIAWKEDSWTFYEEHLKEMAALTKASGQKLAILIVPYEPQLQYRRSPTDHENAVKPQRILLGLCKRHGVPCLDLLPPFSERYDRGEKLYRDGIHLNDAGHRLTASLLERFLTENHLLKSKNTSDG
jgi:lysophospholipase L1-like esterase